MPQASHSVTVRAVIPAEVGMLGRVVAALGAAGGEVGGVDLVRSSRGATVRDITVYTGDEGGAAALSTALDDLEGVEVESINDQIFLAHAGGKLGMRNTARVSTRDDLAMAYCRERFPKGLKLDRREFEKAAKILEPKFVQIRQEPSTRISRDLSEYEGYEIIDEGWVRGPAGFVYQIADEPA